MTDHLEREPFPTLGGEHVLPAVLDDLTRRSQTSSLDYGTPLTADNGRDALVDAYQEALDLVMYLKQALMERNGKQP